MVLDSIDFLALAQYLRADAQIDWHQAIPNCKIPNWNRGMQANASFFGGPGFSEKYFRLENSSQAFSNRWQAAIGDWDAKIVVDIGCGPGNLNPIHFGTHSFSD